MYRKTYAGFVIWLVVFMIIMIAVCFLPAADEAVLIRLLVNLCTLGLGQLTWMIWRNERVYWYNGTEYEAAVAAGSERRRAFAWRHFRIFGWYALGQIVFCCVMHLTGLPWWIDIIAFGVGLSAAAFATMPIKL